MSAFLLLPKYEKAMERIAALEQERDEWQEAYNNQRQIIEDEMRPRIVALEAEVAALRAWRDAVDAELVTMGATAESFPDARAAVKAALDWVQTVALDPCVSQDARALIDQGRAEGFAQARETIAAFGGGKGVPDAQSASAQPKSSNQGETA